MSFQGSIQELPIPDIIQLVSVSGKTGMFTLTRGAERGYIFLKNGQMTHAKLGDVAGEEAVYALAIWSTGEFQFTPGEEAESATIRTSNTSLLMESARRIDEWKVLSRKIPGLESVPTLIARDASEPVMVSPLERNLVLRIDGRKTVEEIARELDSSSFETAKTLYGLITAGLVEMRSGQAARPSAAGELPGDEKKILMTLCARVKRESETALGKSNLTAIERPYKQALLEIERGRGVEAVRDLIRQTEKTISALGGPSKMRSFQDKMSLVMQPKA
ncbi:MAG: DUF4388 domain-containing protein [Acidobacteriota bacterium]|nr:DUF4388 domain-containing protein [Acidobacteriota bacterium]MDQ2978252.1 DUF4388 domain-containing protein [Acidobacteriota bacterium]